MATRSHTEYFIHVRSSFTKPKFTRSTETEELIGSDTVIDINISPPRWTSIVCEIENDIKHIEELVERVKNLYKKQSLPSFNDMDKEIQPIEQICQEILSTFHSSQTKLRKIENYADKKSEEKMVHNVQSRLANDLQIILAKFRKMQSAHIQKLRKQEEKSRMLFDRTKETFSNDYEMDTVMMEANERRIVEREKEVREIAKSIVELSEIFKQLAYLISEQGTILDRIEFNIDETNVQMKKAVDELVLGTRYQKKAAKKKLILLLLALSLILLLVIAFKPRKK